MTTLRFAVDLEIEGDADEMIPLFAQYLTLGGHPFATDYGPGGQGGYDGPFVIGVRVVCPDGSVHTETDWPTHLDGELS